MAEIKVVDDLTKVSIEQKRTNVQKCIDDGVLDATIGAGILKDLDTAMSRAGSSMQEITPNLYISTPVCQNEDNKAKNVRDGKTWVKKYVQGVKGGYVLIKGSNEDDKYSCYPPLSMVLDIINNGDAIKAHLADKARSGHLFKVLGTTRVEDLNVTNPDDILYSCYPA